MEFSSDKYFKYTLIWIILPETSKVPSLNSINDLDEK